MAEKQPYELTPDERLQNQEFERVVIKARQAGVPTENIFVPRSQIKDIIDPLAHETIDELVAKIYDQAIEWAKTRTVIVIDGGDYDRRYKVS